MLTLVIGALRARAAQALTVFVLTAVAAGVAAAGPWFGFASMSAAASADIAAAPAEQRTLSARQNIQIDGDPQGVLDQLAAQARDLTGLPSAQPVSGLVQSMRVTQGTLSDTLPVAYRDEFCAHVTLQGPCPAAAGDVSISAVAGQRLGLRPGDQLIEEASLGTPPVRFRIVSIYTAAEPASAYWSNRLFRPQNGLEPAFTPIETFADDQLNRPTATYDVQLPAELMRGDGGYDLGAALDAAGSQFAREQLELVSSSRLLLDSVARDRATVRTTVTVSLVQVLILAWFAIGLAGRYTSRERRGDAALLKLRGATPVGMLRLAWGQHLIPLFAGAVAGLPLGYLLARLLAGPVGNASDRRSALLLSIAAVAAVLAGGLLVLAVLEALTQRRPVAELLRPVRRARGDWKSGLVNLLLLAVAVLAVYQARVGDPAGGFALAAPGLVAVAVAVLLARLLTWAADRGGGAAVRAGRLRIGLPAARVSRQPGTDRLFALVVVTVAMFTTALGGWFADREHRAVRSTAELGAQRVLTVQAANRTVLEQAVRRADPQGRRAMAAVVDTSTLPAVLAVDSSRLAAVARWRPEYGDVAALSAATAEERRPAPLPAVTGDRLTVRVRHEGDSPAVLSLVLQHEGTGAAVRVSFGPLELGEQSLTGAVTGCSAPPGCRIVRWEVTAPATAAGRVEGAEFPTAVTVRGLTQANPPATILDSATLADINRWRGGTRAAAMNLDASRGALLMEINEESATADYQVWAVEDTLPLPVVLGGPVPDDWRFAEPGLPSLGNGVIPVRVAGTTAALPVLGAAGVLIDLDAATRIIADASVTGTFQVWLAPDAGPDVLAALKTNGLAVLTDETIAAREGRLSRQGPSSGARFALLCGAMTLLLAAATVAVAGAVDRRTRAAEMAALRMQGLTRRTAVLAGWAGTAGLIGTGLVGGLTAAVLAVPLVRAAVPGFTDGWAVLAPPPPLSAAAVALAGLLAAALLGLVGGLSELRMLRLLRREAR
ncbi:hypothetical protein GCM10010172_62580 [Paractinoplanes ferrugineus]|uniref:ABC3 transporter permease C-terminal domain-containing protein n=1 Tax=Paractinoplanes ferrugineus TaxID=113564 RepID=A0A919J7M3_9ACTN|nr:FtsX-like permease family protein [Actinoplanes ferrugineus]GIE16346.1 hypothetical protein Afe05nite_81860 [Actinoplanes ferrugineus]